MGESRSSGEIILPKVSVENARSRRYLSDLVGTYRDAVIEGCSEPDLNLIVDRLVEARMVAVGGNIYQLVMDRDKVTPRERAKAFWEALPQLGQDGLEVMVETLDSMGSPLACTLAVGYELIVFQQIAGCIGQGDEPPPVRELVSAFGRLRSLLQHPVRGERRRQVLRCSDVWRKVTVAVSRGSKTNGGHLHSSTEVLCLRLSRVFLAVVFGDREKISEVMPDLACLQEPDLANVFSDCCRQARDTCERIGLLDVLLFAVSYHQRNPRLVEKACVAIADWLCWEKAENASRMREHLVAQGSLKTLAEMLQRHKEDSDTGTAVLRVLALAADGGHDVKLIIGNLAVLSQALIFLNRRKREPALSAAAARLLRMSTSRCPKNSSFLATGNFVPVICKLLLVAINDDPTEHTISFLQNCCGCLANIFSPPAPQKEVRKNVALIESVQELIEGASDSRNNLLHATLCNIIANIGSSGHLQNFATPSMSDYVTEILCNYQHHDKCLEMALHAIAELMYGNAVAAMRFAKIGGVAMVTDVLKKHGDSKDITYAVFHVLFRVCAENEAAFSGFDLRMMIARACSALRRHSQHEDTVLFALAFFQLLADRHRTLRQVLQEGQIDQRSRQAIRDFPRNKFINTYGKKVISLIA